MNQRLRSAGVMSQALSVVRARRWRPAWRMKRKATRIALLTTCLPWLVVGMQSPSSHLPQVRFNAVALRSRTVKDEDSSAYEAVRVTVAMLQALAPASPEEMIDRLTLTPDTSALTLHDVILRLTRLPKPVVCTGRHSEKRLDIACDALDPVKLPGLARLNAFDVSSINAELRDQRKSRPRATLIELRTDRDHVILSASGYERWREDYRISHPHSIGTQPPDASSPQDVGLVMIVSSKLPDVELRLRRGP